MLGRRPVVLGMGLLAPVLAGFYVQVTTPSEMTGIVWNDLDGDGLREAGEPELAGVRVEVADSEGARRIVVTDARGAYRVPIPAHGDLVVRASAPGFQPTTIGSRAGGRVHLGLSTTFACGCGDGELAQMDSVRLSDGAPVGTLVFRQVDPSQGELVRACLSLRVVTEDEVLGSENLDEVVSSLLLEVLEPTGSGSVDARSLLSPPVRIVDAMHEWTPGDYGSSRPARRTSNVECVGDWIFSTGGDLAHLQGTGEVRIDVLGSWADSLEGLEVAHAARVEARLVYHLATDCGARLGDLVWNDLDQDGVQDPGEPGMPGVRVTLTDTASGRQRQTITGEGWQPGRYEFVGLCPGRYVLDVDRRSGSASPCGVATGQTPDGSVCTPATVDVFGDDSDNYNLDIGDSDCNARIAIVADCRSPVAPTPMINVRGTVTNTGLTALGDVTVRIFGEGCGGAAGSEDASTNLGVLCPGESRIYSGLSYTVGADSTGGVVETCHRATVEGVPLTGSPDCDAEDPFEQCPSPVTDFDDATCSFTCVSQLHLTADCVPPFFFGDPVILKGSVRNSGNTTVRQVRVRNNGAVIAGPVDLVPNEQHNFSVENAPAAGTVTSDGQAGVDASDPCDAPVMSNSVTYDCAVDPHPCLFIALNCRPLADPFGRIRVTGMVTNCGDQDFAAISFNRQRCAENFTSCQTITAGQMFNASFPTSLAAGASAPLSFEVLADPLRPTFMISVCNTPAPCNPGGTTVSATDTVTCEVPCTPCIDVTASCRALGSCSQFEGNPCIRVSGEVRNCGNTNLTQVSGTYQEVDENGNPLGAAVAITGLSNECLAGGTLPAGCISHFEFFYQPTQNPSSLRLRFVGTQPTFCPALDPADPGASSATQVDSTDTTHCNILCSPCIDLSTVCHDARTRAGFITVDGTVTNCGNVRLDAVEAYYRRASDNAKILITLPVTVLEPWESTTFEDVPIQDGDPVAPTVTEVIASGIPQAPCGPDESMACPDPEDSNRICDSSTTTCNLPPPNAKIGDFVWLDENGDGVQNPSEADNGIPDVTVCLRTETGALVGCTTTDDHGFYLFDGLAPGVYMVDVKTPPGLFPTVCVYSVAPPNVADDSNCSPTTVTLGRNECNLTIDFGFVEELACRMTGGGNDVYQGDRYTFGGQAGAPTAEQPQPYGEWTHHQQEGPDGEFVFHVGTSSAPTGTEIDLITCSDPGWCRPARPAPAKQLDFEGVGAFNSGDRDFFIQHGIIPHETLHWVEVHVEDAGEPGSHPEPPGCRPEGSAGLLLDCDCPDFYSITIYANADRTSPVIYHVHGYLDGGNIQLHPPVGGPVRTPR